MLTLTLQHFDDFFPKHFAIAKSAMIILAVLLKGYFILFMLCISYTIGFVICVLMSIH